MVTVLESESEVKAKSLNRVRLFATPWTVAYQAPLSMGFSRQECWSGLPFPSPGDLSDPGIEPGSSALQADTLPSELPGKDHPPAGCNFAILFLYNWRERREERWSRKGNVSWTLGLGYKQSAPGLAWLWSFPPDPGLGIWTGNYPLQFLMKSKIGFHPLFIPSFSLCQR